MDAITRKAFSLLRDIKSVTFATVNEGDPAALIIDVMLAEEDS